MKGYYSKYDYSGYLRVAIRLSSLSTKTENDKETFWRDAVSRAYYAAFHGVKLFIWDVLEDELGPGSTHESLWNFFKKPNRKYAPILDAGQRLKIWREWADYNDPAKPAPPDFETVMETIDQLRTGLLNICPDRAKAKTLCWFLTDPTKPNP